jgi:hypothetical protein
MGATIGCPEAPVDLSQLPGAFLGTVYYLPTGDHTPSRDRHESQRYLEVSTRGVQKPPAVTIEGKRAIYERLKRAQAEGSLSEDVAKMLNLGPG